MPKQYIHICSRCKIEVRMDEDSFPDKWGTIQATREWEEYGKGKRENFNLDLCPKCWDEMFSFREEIKKRTPPKLVLDSIPNGIEIIKKARDHQIEEGFDISHDLTHKDGELIKAAVIYARNTIVNFPTVVPEGWPFEARWWKPSLDPIEDLGKAGAFIAADIDRIVALRR